MARTRKPAESSNPCKQCGARPTYLTPVQAGDDEGYHFMVCSAECGREPSWATSKQAVIQLWNAVNPIEGTK